MTTPRDVSYAEARDYLHDRALQAGDFTESLVLVTPDSILYVDRSACHEWRGPFLCLWFEHRAPHIEHRDEVIFFDAWT